MSIDVPKQLGVQQIAIRALHISYDDCDVFRYIQQVYIFIIIYYLYYRMK